MLGEVKHGGGREVRKKGSDMRRREVVMEADKTTCESGAVDEVLPLSEGRGGSGHVGGEKPKRAESLQWQCKAVTWCIRFLAG